MIQAQFTIGTFAIISDDSGRILLSKRSDMNLWNLPGGGLEYSETPEEGCIREVLEETGLNVEVIEPANISTKINDHEIVFTFTCKIIGGELMLTEEAIEHRYFLPKDFPENTSKRQVERIQKYIHSGRYQSIKQ